MLPGAKIPWLISLNDASTARLLADLELLLPALVLID